MISKKEKLIAEYIYQKCKLSGVFCVKKEDLIRDMAPTITEPGIYNLLIYNRSDYLKWRGGGTSILELTPKGIAYMEKIEDRQKEAEEYARETRKPRHFGF